MWARKPAKTASAKHASPTKPKTLGGSKSSGDLNRFNLPAHWKTKEQKNVEEMRVHRRLPSKSKTRPFPRVSRAFWSRYRPRAPRPAPRSGPRPTLYVYTAPSPRPTPHSPHPPHSCPVSSAHTRATYYSSACALRTVLRFYFPSDTLTKPARPAFLSPSLHTHHPSCNGVQRVSLPRACSLLPRCSLRFSHAPLLTRSASHTLRSLAHLARFASQQRRAARTCARACWGQSSRRGRRRRTPIPRRARCWEKTPRRPPCGRRTRTTSS